VRQLTYIEPGRLEWTDIAEPGIEGPKQAIVQPLAVATCDLDLAIIRGLAPIPGPFAFGHEFVADVVEVGEEVRSVKAGDRVVVPFQITCGECDRCRSGLTANCTGVEPRRAMYGLGTISGKDWGGAVSDRVRVPFADSMLVRLPEGIDPVAVASMSDNIPDAWRTVGPPLAQSPGGSVLVVAGGAPSIGLYAAALAKSLGASSVEYVDSDPGRLELAARFGATVVEGPPPRKRARHAITVDASADPAGLACALRSTEPGGVCTSVGIYYTPETPVPLLEMYTYGVTFVTGRVDARPAIPGLLDLVLSGKFHPEEVTTAVVPWEEASSALLEPVNKLVMVREGVAG
jgi:threonine dehydrogenase-like Zn-dependent dehydrogenase